MKDICSVNCKNEDIINENKHKIAAYFEIDKTAEFFKLLSNQSRLKILLILFNNELCVCDIAESIGLSVPATSQQLRMLRQAEILAQRNNGKTIYYSFITTAIEKLVKQLIFHTV